MGTMLPEKCERKVRLCDARRFYLIGDTGWRREESAGASGRQGQNRLKVPLWKEVDWKAQLGGRKDLKILFLKSLGKSKDSQKKRESTYLAIGSGRNMMS